MVKNRILGLAALLLGFGLVITQSAFTSKSEKREQFAFHYSGPTDMTISQVQNEENWSYDEDQVSCPSGSDQACSLLVDRNYVDNPDTAPALSSSAALTASAGATKAIVTGSADPLSIIPSNRSL